MKITKIVRTLSLLTLLTGMGSFFPSAVASAQDIAGTWSGKLKLPMGTLTLVFHIDQTENGAYVTTVDSPDQGAKGISTQSTTFKDSTLTVSIGVINASYRGKWVNEQTIEGKFTQGMTFPLNLTKGEALQPKRPQEPRPPFPYHSEEVTVHTEEGITLAGTLTIPAEGGDFPAAVLLTGSGQQNRDEEIMGHKPFLVLADYLTRHGIAVLRCDDRGTGASKGNHATATNEDFAADAEAMVRFLRGRKEINAKKIGLIGHSAGANIAFMTAKRDADIAFIVSLAGAGVRGDSLMLKQVELLSKSQGMSDADWEQMKPALRNRYEMLRRTDRSPKELQEWLYADVTKSIPSEMLKSPETVESVTAQLRTMTSPWYLHFMRHDPADDLRAVHCPVLALNGDKDLQVDATRNLNAIREQIIAGGNNLVTVKLYPNLNHLFQTCKLGTPAEYARIEETISPQVLKEVTEWIGKLVK